MTTQDQEDFVRECRYCGNVFITDHGNRQFCPREEQFVGQRDCKMTFNNLKARDRRNAIKVKNAYKRKVIRLSNKF